MKTFSKWLENREAEALNEGRDQERRILRKMLEDDGFTWVRESGPHDVFEKDKLTFSITKNVRNPRILFKKTQGNYNKAKVAEKIRQAS